MPSQTGCECAILSWPTLELPDPFFFCVPASCDAVAPWPPSSTVPARCRMLTWKMTIWRQSLIPGIHVYNHQILHEYTISFTLLCTDIWRGHEIYSIIYLEKAYSIYTPLSTPGPPWSQAFRVALAFETSVFSVSGSSSEGPAAEGDGTTWVGSTWVSSLISTAFVFWSFCSTTEFSWAGVSTSSFSSAALAGVATGRPCWASSWKGWTQRKGNRYIHNPN